jgi:CRP/FNR family transcriptional regulator, cyclic AMP receptor protein
MNRAHLNLLKGVDLFSSLSDIQIALLATMTVEQTFPRGQTILAESETSETFFLIAQGSVKVALTAEGGREVILATLGKGDFFGEMSLLDGEPRSAAVRAVTKTNALLIHRDDFVKSLKRHPDLALALLAELSKRLRGANRQISSLALMRVWGRVAVTLLKLIEERGIRTHTKEGKNIVIIHGRPTHKMIAEMSGTTRETVTRVFKTLEDRGAIATSGRDLVILEENLLR